MMMMTIIGIISLNKLMKTLDMLRTKYGVVEHLRPVFVSLKNILERKEKAIIEIIDIIEEMEQEETRIFTDEDSCENVSSSLSQSTRSHVYLTALIIVIGHYSEDTTCV